VLYSASPVIPPGGELGGHPFGFSSSSSSSSSSHPPQQRSMKLGGGFLNNTARSKNHSPGENNSLERFSLLSKLPPPSHNASLPTPLSSTTVAHYSFPITIHLAHLPHLCVNPSGPSPPILFLTAHSTDTDANTHHVEGYASFELPVRGEQSAGSGNASLRAWRPAEEESKATEKFLGGAQRLSDTTACRVPGDWGAGAAWRGGDMPLGAGAAATAAGGARTPALTPQALSALGGSASAAYFSRMGSETESTGEFALRYNLIRQWKAGPPVGHNTPEVAAARQRLGFGLGGSKKTVEEVIAEAQAVRKRDSRRSSSSSQPSPSA